MCLQHSHDTLANGSRSECNAAVRALPYWRTVYLNLHAVPSTTSKSKASMPRKIKCASIILKYLLKITSRGTLQETSHNFVRSIPSDYNPQVFMNCFLLSFFFVSAFVPTLSVAGTGTCHGCVSDSCVYYNLNTTHGLCVCDSTDLDGLLPYFAGTFGKSIKVLSTMDSCDFVEGADTPFTQVARIMKLPFPRMKQISVTTSFTALICQLQRRMLPTMPAPPNATVPSAGTISRPPRKSTACTSPGGVSVS
jgi:hypothetical protein